MTLVISHNYTNNDYTNYTNNTHNHTNDTHNHTNDTHNHTNDTHNYTNDTHIYANDTHNWPQAVPRRPPRGSPASAAPSGGPPIR